MFVVKTPPGGFVHLHTHPYSETFVLLAREGPLDGRRSGRRGRAGHRRSSCRPETLHGFRNIGDEPLLVVSVHESGTLDQTFTEHEPA